MYILIVFLFSPPSLLHLYPPLFDMNTLTLYFYQPTNHLSTLGTIHVIDLHPPARFLIAAADRRVARALLCSRDTLHTDHRSICWIYRHCYAKKKKIRKKKTIKSIFSQHAFNENDIRLSKSIQSNRLTSHHNCCSWYRNNHNDNKTISRHAKSITYHVRLLVVHAWARKDGNGGWVSGRRGSRPLQFTGARRFCRRIRAVVEAAGNRAPRAATARGAATGTGPTGLSLSRISPFPFYFTLLIRIFLCARVTNHGAHRRWTRYHCLRDDRSRSRDNASFDPCARRSATSFRRLLYYTLLN